MEIAGYLKVLILFFALAVPISIVFLVYRTLFSGLNSISKTSRGNPEADTGPDQAQNNKPTENEDG